MFGSARGLGVLPTQEAAAEQSPTRGHLFSFRHRGLGSGCSPTEDGLGFHVLRECFTLHLLRVELRRLLDSFSEVFPGHGDGEGQLLEAGASRGSHLRHPSACWPGLLPISKASEAADREVKTFGGQQSSPSRAPSVTAHVVPGSEGCSLLTPEQLISKGL